MPATMERFEFDGHTGEKLAARLDRPAGTPKASVLFAHCFTCTKDIEAARRIARQLSARGLAVMRFDFTGLGHSEGEFANTGFRSNVEDLRRAAQALADRVAPPQLLIGHSLGGAAVLAAAGSIESVRAVATIGAPADPAHVLHNLGGSVETIRRDGEGTVTLGGREIRIGRGFIEDVESSKLSEAIGALGRALLVLHTPLDTIVGIENAAEIFSAARHPRSFVTLDDADHLLTKPSDAEYAAEVIATWAARYLDLEEPTKPTPPPEGIVRVAEADPAGFLQDVLSGPHHFLADEPAKYGGTNMGMTPYQFLSAGLGACTAMTIRMYARRKGIGLTHVSVDVFHDKVHAEDCAACETAAGKIDVFRREIRLEGNLSEAERARLREIADRCPVHRTFESEIKIETVMV